MKYYVNNDKKVFCNLFKFFEYKNQKLLLEGHKLFKDTIDLVHDVEVKRNLIMNFIEYFTYDSQTNEIGYKLRL